MENVIEILVFEVYYFVLLSVVYGGVGMQVLVACYYSHSIDRFHSIFQHRNWSAKVSCDVDINQSAGSMVM